MLLKPETCAGCALYESPLGKKHGFSVPSGNGATLVIAEALGKDEEQEGIPLVGKSGYALFQQLKRIDIERDQFTLFNTIACRPPDNRLVGMPFEQSVITHCAPNLDRVIEDTRKRARDNGKTFVIITLGVTPFKRILGLDYKKDSNLLKLDYYAYPFWSDQYSCWVLNAPHPAYLVRGNTQLWPVIQFVFKRALEIADNGLVLDEHDYLLDPHPAGFEEYIVGYERSLKDDPDNPISYDIETPYKKKVKDEEELGKEEDADHTILRIAFSYWFRGRTYTTSVKWSAEYLHGIERLFSIARFVLGWNSNRYDNPRVSRHVEIKGIDLDGMVAWHILNTSLPKSLGFVTPYYWQNTLMWKHLSESQPAFYNAKDADAALRNFRGIRKDLEDNKLWHVYERHWIELNKALKYMTGIGVLRDNVMRDQAEADMSRILDEIETRMEEAVPDEAREVKIFKKEPKVHPEGLFATIKDYPVEYCSKCGVQGPRKWKQHIALCGGELSPILVVHCGTCGLRLPKKYKEHKKLCGGPLINIEELELTFPITEINESFKVWGLPLEFKISKKRLTSYQHFLRHQAILDRKERKVTFDADAITLLVKKYPSDPLYPRILEHRKIQKLYSTYIGVTEDGRLHGGMPIGKDGRIHTSYGRDASTLRFTSEDPNLQNLPRPNPSNPDDLANIIRNLVVAKAGSVLYARDFSGIEAVLTGYFALDPKYIRIAKRDVHTYYTVYALYELEGGARIKSADLPDLDWADDRLFPYLEALKGRFKAERNNLYKHLVHACVTGDHEVLTPYGWERLDQLKENEHIAQWDDGILSWVVPSKIISGPFNGELVSLFGKGVSVKMTPNHRIPVYNSYKSLHERYADSLPKSGSIPVCGQLSSNKQSENHEWLKLAVAIQADGHFPEYGTQMRFHLVKQRKRTRLKEILTTLNVPFKIRPCTDHLDGEHIWISYSDVEPVFVYLDEDKSFNLPVLLSISQQSREVFLDEVILWDGHKPKTRTNRQTSYISTNQHNAEAVQTISHITNRQSLLRYYDEVGKKRIYKVSFNSRKFAALEQLKQGHEPFNGMVYCVTVPSGWFLIKYNDRISVTGNSNFMQGAYGARDKIFSETGIEYPVATVKKVMDVYYALFPKIKQWHKNVMDEAEKDGYLRNPFDYVCRFNRVYDYKKEFGEWAKKPGADANKAIAFKPQSTAVGIITEAILRMYFERFEEVGQYLRLQVHDELLFEVPREEWKRVDIIIKEEMERPIEQMRLPTSWNMGTNLNILTEAKIDLSEVSRWGSMKGIKD